LIVTEPLCRLGLTSTGEFVEDKVEKQGLRGGLLLEFKKDSERVLLAVTQRPDGKKNWMVADQVQCRQLTGYVKISC